MLQKINIEPLFLISCDVQGFCQKMVMFSVDFYKHQG